MWQRTNFITGQVSIQAPDFSFTRVCGFGLQSNPSVKGGKLEAGEITFSKVLAAEVRRPASNAQAHVEKPGTATVVISVRRGGSKRSPGLTNGPSAGLRVVKLQSPRRDRLSSKTESPKSKQNKNKWRMSEDKSLAFAHTRKDKTQVSGLRFCWDTRCRLPGSVLVS